mgnify:CR=1 FL=1
MGKTTVSNMFRDLGVQVWCADNEVKELYKINGAATKILSNEFNKNVDLGFFSVVLEGLALTPLVFGHFGRY